mgnify:CR=1 FL=1
MDNSEKKNVELNIDNGELKTSMIPEDFTDPQILYDKLISMIKKYHPSGDISQIEKAYKIAYKAHDGQLRKSGEPYIIHPVCVCIILAELELDKETIVAGMLHDVVEDTVMTSEEIAAEFGDEVALLVDGVTKLTQLNYVADKVEVQAENLRKMFLAMAKDIRVILIKLADRLHNQRTMQYQTPEKQKEKSRETLDIYAPIADRLGISKVKVELDDLAFRYLEPEVYNNLVARLDKGRVRREEFIKQIVAEVDKHIKAAGIEATIDGRAKHYFSIYKKMITQNKKLEQIYDLFAVRIIVDTERDCYTALGVIHEIYKPIPGHFKDYIAMPKPNNYQSLHTTLIGPQGQPFEIQIRTYEMHRTSEYGIAAHWMYKEGRANQDELDSKLAWLREALELENYADTTKEFVESIRKDFFSDYVYVLTPRGQIIDLVTGSTPLDFAYRIHSNVGNHVQHAKVNGAIVRLDYKLKNNDVCEIVTAPNATPSRDWLKIVKTQQAKAKIRQWFKKANREENIIRGKEMLSEAAKRQGRQLGELTKKSYYDDLLKRFNMNDIEDIYAAIGYGGITTGQVLHKLIEQYRKEEKANQLAAKLEQKEEQRVQNAVSHHGVVVKGEPNMAVRFAHCCSPLPGDKIVGYITRGRGVSIHRADCPNMTDLMLDKERLIDVEWASTEKASYPVTIHIVAGERPGLLMEISQLLMNLNISILAMNAKTTEDIVTVQLTFNVSGAAQLDSIMKGMRKIRTVNDVYRINA